MTTWQRRLGFLIGCWLLLSAVGCEEATRGLVEGTVTVNGEPAEMGSITFIPVDGMSQTAGAKITEGKYSAEVPFGQMKVQVRVSKVVGQVKIYNTPDSPVQDLLEEVLPPKYNQDTELEINVEKGTNEHNFDLETKKKR